MGGGFSDSIVGCKHCCHSAGYRPDLEMDDIQESILILPYLFRF